MAVLSDVQIAEAARKAGFSGQALVTVVAIGLAESGGRTDAVGDVNLVDGKWGPSLNVWQIRSLHDQRGTGGPRDEFALRDVDHAARAAFSISGGGANFAPWSVYKNGRYQAFMGRAEAAVGRIPGGVRRGIEDLPGVGGLIDDAKSSAQRAVMIGLAVAGGVTLVVMGLWRGTR